MKVKTKNEEATPRLPCDPQAELAVIEGSLFPGGFDRATAILSASDFSTVGGKKIFAAMESLARTGRPISVSLIERALDGDPDFPQIVRALDSIVPFTHEAVTHFATIVRELSLRRKLMRLAADAVWELADVTVPIENATASLLDEAREAVIFVNGGRDG